MENGQRNSICCMCVNENWIELLIYRLTFRVFHRFEADSLPFRSNINNFENIFLEIFLFVLYYYLLLCNAYRFDLNELSCQKQAFNMHRNSHVCDFLKRKMSLAISLPHEVCAFYLYFCSEFLCVEFFTHLISISSWFISWAVFFFFGWSDHTNIRCAEKNAFKCF